MMSRQTIEEDNLGQNGVLNVMVQQPCDSALDISWQNGARYTERWKGPFSEMKNISAAGGTVMGRKLIVGKVLPAPGGLWKGFYHSPPILSDMKWVVDAITASEIEAGEHGILEITSRAVPEDEEIGGYGSNADPSGSGEISTEVVTDQSGWTLRWATYSRSPLEYATQEPNPYTGSASEPSKVAHADCVIRCA